MQWQNLYIANYALLLVDYPFILIQYPCQQMNTNVNNANLTAAVNLTDD